MLIWTSAKFEEMFYFIHQYGKQLFLSQPKRHWLCEQRESYYKIKKNILKGGKNVQSFYRKAAFSWDKNSLRRLDEEM